MKIYTKKGDEGETSLFGGKRVKKDHPRIEAYGAIDALNSWVGLILCEIPEGGEGRKILLEIQKDLLTIGSILATPDVDKVEDLLQLSLRKNATSSLEGTIDRWESELTPLKSFILPGGTRLASLCHVARTSCRYAERKIVGLSQKETISPEILAYINRLSDFFFVMARWSNAQKGHLEAEWKGRSR
ncbi:MAG: ATP:cob(I)alamin adenosyltransferase [Deltaproteobacteria bacterium RIFCSPLOWO2_02_FULL_50_16]|nr:MAG: ATP:cob(I)alamin adenosyltransferase [Deltaproteobacteria bacterium RIFCSPHIGHO2_02_FULL_50_15]OGQ55692.1 MAG: ATP:cob(I)alamin adenosyltransferase [Deltaproteobacteria bacterium RIFCSPLOWO2_02_FULL_50_16]OGQ66195.1 MAG: ATP:cob(I)alamin adenosyltransferase [Deltaproteobacteria bacterium RIFCSPLOWO2_12_FULL_50_11]